MLLLLLRHLQHLKRQGRRSRSKGAGEQEEQEEQKELEGQEEEQEQHLFIHATGYAGQVWPGSGVVAHCPGAAVHGILRAGAVLGVDVLAWRGDTLTLLHLTCCTVLQCNTAPRDVRTVVLLRQADERIVVGARHAATRLLHLAMNVPGSRFLIIFIVRFYHKIMSCL